MIIGSRQILRATWFCILEKKLFPYPEVLAEKLEQSYQNQMFNVPIFSNDNLLEIQFLSADDMREYTVGGSKDEYRVVIRGYSQTINLEQIHYPAVASTNS